MPPSPAYPDAVRTTLVFTLPNTDVAENVIHWSVGADAVVDNAFCVDLASQIGTAFELHWAGIVDTGVTLDRIVVQDLRTTPYFTREVAQGIPGANSGQIAMPWQMAAVMSLHTIHAGRRGRGRIYMGGLCEDANIAGGKINPLTIDELIGFGTALDGIETAHAQDVLWGVLSRSDAQVYAVDAWTMDNRWDVQRRRANRRIS